jgi:hypothetical protein
MAALESDNKKLQILQETGLSKNQKELAAEN